MDEVLLEIKNRFILRRGLISDLYSDNSTNLVGASNELKRLHILFLEEGYTIQNTLLAKGIQWHFIPPRDPHFGGLWVAADKSMKHLRRLASNAKMTFEVFQILLCQIEAILNSRPLYPLSSDANDESALTPGHFIIGDALRSISEPSLAHLPLNRLSWWQLIQSLKQHFWKRWQKECLHEL